MKTLKLTTILGLLLAAHTFNFESQAGKGGNGKGGGGGGKNKPGKNEPGQIIPVQLVFDTQHTVTLENNRLVSDGLGTEPGDPDSYFHGVNNALIDVGENFSIVLDPNDTNSNTPARSFAFPNGINVLAGLTCDDLTGACLPDLGTKKVKGQHVPLLECTNPPTGPNLAGIMGRAMDAAMIFRGDNHDDTPVGCVRYVNARLELIDDDGEGWTVYFGGRPSPGGFIESPCGNCINVERQPNNVDGQAVWTFHTEAPHCGYLYRDNRPPHHPSELHGIVSLPFSGTLISLDPESEPDTLACGDFDDSSPCPNSPKP